MKKKISVLLSCKKCPENKGGYICKKEYDNKCLAQKIQHIKELQEENAKLEQQIERMKCCTNCKHTRTEYEHCRTDKHEKWELKE